MFKLLVKTLCRRQNIYMLINYSRPVLNQTGDGHFSPIGGFCEEDQKSKFKIYY